jgi:hypothetical protein
VGSKGAGTSRVKISGHKTRAVFDRYHIASTDDVADAMRQVELSGVKV